jgi:phosphatidate phosphatase APP1
MPLWRRAPLRILYEIRRVGSSARFRIRRGLGLMRAVGVTSYVGYGTDDRYLVLGRVVEDLGLLPAHREHSKRQNFAAMLRRFTAASIPHACVRVTLRGHSEEITTDEEGYFELEVPAGPAADEFTPWRDFTVELVKGGIAGQAPVRIAGTVLVPPIDSEVGIISDIDDTVLETGAVNLLRMIRVTFFNNALTRLPFEGVAAFYRALERGPGGSLHNPVFYVSSGPWNLYDMIADFFAVQGIPRGPILLQDFGVDRDKFIKLAHDRHKLEQIERIMATYPALPFVLIGDSGQHDPEIYARVVEDFPGRVRAIYIRDVASAKRSSQVEEVVRGIQARGVPVVLSPDTVAAAEHAAENGLIAGAALAEIRAEQAKDQDAPTELEQLMGR